MEENTPENWLQLYRQGIGGADVARMCGEPDTLSVLRHLTAAKQADAGLEALHFAALNSRARKFRRTSP